MVSFNAKKFLESLFQARVDLPTEWTDEYEERAGILEFDGGLARQEAEDQAKRELQRRVEKPEKVGALHLQSTCGVV